MHCAGWRGVKCETDRVCAAKSARARGIGFKRPHDRTVRFFRIFAPSNVIMRMQNIVTILENEAKNKANGRIKTDTQICCRTLVLTQAFYTQSLLIARIRSIWVMRHPQKKLTDRNE